MKKFYIQPNIQLQPMHIREIICESATRTVTSNVPLELQGPGTGIDPM